MDCVYAVYEDPVNLRWVYQEYKNSGKYRFQVDRQYMLGNGRGRRYYLDATLTPVMMPGTDGKLTEIMHQVMVYHKKWGRRDRLPVWRSGTWIPRSTYKDGR